MTDDPFVCPDCGRGFDQEDLDEMDGLATQVEEVDGKEIEVFTCADCDTQISIPGVAEKLNSFMQGGTAGN